MSSLDEEPNALIQKQEEFREKILAEHQETIKSLPKKSRFNSG